MKRLLIYAATTLGLLLSCGDADAGRTSDRTFFADILPMVSVHRVPSGGIGVCAGQYILNSYWKAGVAAVNFSTGSVFDGGGRGPVTDHTHYRLEGGWMYRLCGSYSRAFSLYGGGSVLIGADTAGPFRRMPEEILSPFTGTAFVYGIQPELLAEFFVSRGVALTLGIQGPFSFGGLPGAGLWHLTGSFGVRINL